MNHLSYFNYYSQKFELDYPVENYNGSNSDLMLEEGIKIGAGGEQWKLYAQYELGIHLMKSDVSWYTGNFQAGVNFRFGKQFKKKRSIN